MPLLPTLPVISGESLTSYLARVAKYHGDMDPLKFLDLIEFSQGSAKAPDEDAMTRLSNLIGINLSELQKMTFQSTGSRMRSFCGHVVHSEFANLDQTTYCPACLLEDGRPDSVSGGHRIGRVHWQIRHIRTCEQHGIGLVRRKNVSHSEKLQLMSVVAPDDQALISELSTAPKQEVSDLQKYVVDRLAGKTGPAWLDGQPIDLAARACEMIGIILTAGTHVNLHEVNDAAWNEAGQVGFEYALTGGEGISAALRLAYDRFAKQGLRGGPQKAFGRLYQWLQFSKNNKPVGPIRDVVREFILKNFPVEEGNDLLGETVNRQRVHSAYSLAKKSGGNYKTIYRAVVLAGLLEGDPEKPTANDVFDAEAGEALMQRIQTSIPVVRLTDYFNCNRVQAEQLVRTGVVPRLIPNADNLTGILKQVAREDADAFLVRLLGAAKRVEVASEGVMDIVSAAAISRWPVMDIIEGILAGKFANVECVDPALKFKGILVDPIEVRKVLSDQKSDGRVGLEDGARIIGMPEQGLSALAKMRKPDGSAYVVEHFVKNSKGSKSRLFSIDDLQKFANQHISLKEIAEQNCFAPKIMKMKLDGRGLIPLAPKYELGRIWYRREDLSAF